MMTEADSVHAGSAQLASVTSLLDAFSPRRRDSLPAERLSDAKQTLWDSDAIHRANNLAQMAASLSRIDQTRFGVSTGIDIASKAEALAASYAALGACADGSAGVPCSMLLERISTALVSLFCEGSLIHLQYRAHDVVLAPVRRRATILIASELLINALKYAFPDARAGVVHVSLMASDGTGELVVEDDGIGFTGLERAGTGSGLVTAMTRLLDGYFEKGHRVGGGARCSVTFPVHTARGNLASGVPEETHRAW